MNVMEEIFEIRRSEKTELNYTTAFTVLQRRYVKWAQTVSI